MRPLITSRYPATRSPGRRGDPADVVQLTQFLHHFIYLLGIPYRGAKDEFRVVEDGERVLGG